MLIKYLIRYVQTLSLQLMSQKSGKHALRPPYTEVEKDCIVVDYFINRIMSIKRSIELKTTSLM